MNMTNLFVYGSLMFDQVLTGLVQGRYEKVDAELRGYARLQVRGELYPGLVRATRGRVQGAVLTGVTADDLQRLDLFEGHYYKRIAVRVYMQGTIISAQTYVFRQRYRRLLSSSEWQPVQFKQRYLQRFLKQHGLAR